MWVLVGWALVGALVVGVTTDVDDDGGADVVGVSLGVCGGELDDGGTFDRVLDLEGGGDGDFDGGVDVGGGGGASMVKVSVDWITAALAEHSPMIW